MPKIPKERLLSLIDSMRGRSIMVVGDLMLDEYIWGVVERISPEAPVPVVDVREETFRLGGAGNVAKNLTTLEAKVSMQSVIGQDRPGHIVTGMLSEQGVSTGGLVVDENRRTIVKTRIIANTQQVVRIDKEDRDLITNELKDALVQSIIRDMDSVDAVIISDYGKGVITRELIDVIVKNAAKRSLLVSVDPKERNFAHYHGVGLITPNAKETCFAAGMTAIGNDEDLKKAAGRIFDQLGCGMILVTRGALGMSLFETREQIAHIPTMARKVFDVTGAGDTVISCFTLASTAGATPFEAAAIANCAAGMVVGEIGAASVSLDSLRAQCLEDICAG